MREMKDSGIEWIGTIPKNWKLLRIQYGLYEIKENNTLKKTSQVLSLVKDNGVMLYEEKGNKGNKSKEDISQYKIAYPNTLIVNSMNILIGSVGISKYTGCVSPVYYVFKETEQTDLRYINYIFNTREFQKELRKYANGILEIRLRVSANDIFKRKIPFPNKQTQKLIADFLDKKCAEIDALTADIQTQIETLEEYKKSIITEAVTKGLDPNVEMKDSGVEWIGKIPANWTVIKIKYLSNEVNQKKLMNTESMYSYLGLENLKSYSDEIIKTETDYDEGIQKFCHKGNVLFSKLRPYLAKVMICPYDTFATSEFLELSPSECVCDANYLKYSMLNSSFINEVNLSTYGAKMPRADASYIKNIKICITNLDEQHRIADFLDHKCSEIDQTISEKQQQLDTLAEYKKSLIYEYVTGKKEVA